MIKWTYQAANASNLPTSFKVTQHELALALSRTILGRAPSNFYAQRFAAAMEPILDLQLHPVNGPLELIPDFRKVFRDFSGTTRIGEFAQALAYHHFVTTGPFSHIVDFLTWVEGHGGKAGVQSTPDFVLLNAASTQRPIGVLEAKGSIRWKGLLTRAKKQAEAGKRILADPPIYLPVHHVFAACTQFKIAGVGNHPTTLWVEDPDSSPPPTDPKVYDEMLRRSYASFWSALGHGDFFATANASAFLEALEPLPPAGDEKPDPLPHAELVPLRLLPESPLLGLRRGRSETLWSSSRFFIQEDALKFNAGLLPHHEVQWPTAEIRAQARERGLFLYTDGTAFRVH